MIDAWCGKLAGPPGQLRKPPPVRLPGCFQRLQAAGSAGCPTYYRRGRAVFYLAMAPEPLAMSNSYFFGLSA